MKQYVQTDLEADRQVANTLAELIIGGSLTSTRVRLNVLRTGTACPMAATLAVLRHHT
jgi:hypothetical protein